jgi:hypothetical protein
MNFVALNSDESKTRRFLIVAASTPVYDFFSLKVSIILPTL